jgi:hypothetical protein
MLVIIPILASTTDNEFVETTARAGIQILNMASAKLYDLFPVLLEKKDTVVQLEPRQLALLSRYASEFFEFLPIVVTEVPGAVYTKDFDQLANLFLMEPWDMFRRRLAKSGTLSQTSDQVEKRSVSSQYSDDMREQVGDTRDASSSAKSASLSFNEQFKKGRAPLTDSKTKGDKEEDQVEIDDGSPEVY